MRILIYGGTFDPPTSAHLSMITAVARKQNYMDLILVAPTNSPYYKGKQMFTFEQRCEMLQIMLQLIAGICTGGSLDSYTPMKLWTGDEGGAFYETMMKIRKEYGQNDYYFLIGADSYYDLPNWKNAKDLMRVATPVVMPRQLSGFHAEFLDESICPGSSSNVREELSNGNFDNVPRPFVPLIEKYLKPSVNIDKIKPEESNV
jgi:nicotinate-nucleotide adenylyltransferase